jgi:hypothetical protein
VSLFGYLMPSMNHYVKISDVDTLICHTY